MSRLRFIGLDVHAKSITVAIAEANGGEAQCWGEISNDPDAVRKLVKKLGPVQNLRVCYEAGPTGYVLYWQLAQLGVECEVIAPSLTPVKPGDRVKTNRRDALKLARLHRSGDLTKVQVPDTEREGLRDLVRARECALQDKARARNRLSKFLLRHGRRAPTGVRAWTQKFWEWVQGVHFELPAQEFTLLDYIHEVEHARFRLQRLEQAVVEAIKVAPPRLRELVQALQALRGVAELTAVTVVSEVGSFSRFTGARQLMAYTGVVASEASTGDHVCRGGITKTGNAHLRRVVGEAAWAYRHRPTVGKVLRQRQEKLGPRIIEIAWKAQHRLHTRYRKLMGRGKKQQTVITAITRELLGFMWAIGVEVESQAKVRSTSA